MENEYQTLQASELFDASWYLEQYPDVAKSGMDPIVHYLRYGWRMHRNPSVTFDMRQYLSHNADVARSGKNPLLHFIQKGQSEGRQVHPVRQVVRAALPQLAWQPPPSVLPPATGNEADSVGNQLDYTQHLLEHYYTRCQALEYQLLDRE